MPDNPAEPRDDRLDGACPNCGGIEIVEGKLVGQLDLGGGFAFRPKRRGLISALFRIDAPIRHPMFGCTGCGLVWTFITSTRRLS